MSPQHAQAAFHSACHTCDVIYKLHVSIMEKTPISTRILEVESEIIFSHFLSPQFTGKKRAMPSAVRAFSIGHVLVCSAYLQHTHIHLAFFVRLCIFSSPNATLTHNDPN